MNKDEADKILEKYLTGKANTEEQAFIDHWYLKMSDDLKLNDSDNFERLDDELWLGTKRRAGLLSIERPARTLWPKLALVGSLLLMSGFGFWFYKTNVHRAEVVTVVVNDVKPGHNMATLTLVNGQTITLSDAKTGLIVAAKDLSYNDGSPVAVRSENKQETITKDEPGDLVATTPRGGTYQITLPDGSHVWLNAESKLIFPSKFSAAERKVQLIGEAYFEVAKVKFPVNSHNKGISGSRNVPFIVVSKNQEIEVLGTHFNVSSYLDEANVKTTLLEGSVKVRALDSKAGRNNVVLKPGQQAIVGKDSEINVSDTDVELAVAWKNGLFYFKDADLKVILRTFSRWYDIDVVSADDQLAERKFSGKLYRNLNAHQALQVLKLLGVDFNFEKRESKLPQKKTIKP